MNTVADEAAVRVGYNQGIFHKIEQDNCFIIRHIDKKKSTVLLQKSWRRSSFLLFFSPTHKITYIAGYMLTCVWTTTIKCTMTIFGQCYNVLNNNGYYLPPGKVVFAIIE